MKYKVGDKVRVREWEVLKKDLGLSNCFKKVMERPSRYFDDSLKFLHGEVFTIEEVCGEYYLVKETDCIFTDDMLYGLVEDAPEVVKKNHSVIIVKQGAGYYLFLCDHDVPIGSTVLCETAYGRKDGITVTPAFSVNDDEYATLLKQFGTKESRMKKVIGTVEYHLFEDGDKA